MAQPDAIVVGGGVSGLGFAFHAAAAGRKALLVEAAPRLGGCLDSRRLEGGFWFEMGAHTCYNSYGALLEMVEGSGIRDRILARGDARKRFALMRDGGLDVMGPLSVLTRFSLWELLRSAPRGLMARKQGQTTYGYYGGVVGKGNYARVLGPFLAAVPSQSADAFPAAGPGSLFKKRPRRKDVARSFTFRGGLSDLVDAVAARPGVSALTGAVVREVRRRGAGFEALLADGRSMEAPLLALAVPPSMAAALTRNDFPELSARLARIKMAALETLGVVVPREKVRLPELAFLVPFDDLFWSAVSRDPVPDPRLRGFAFHFRTGQTREARLSRIAEVLGCGQGDFLHVADKTTMLPSPVMGHAAVVAELDRLLAGGRLAVTGNYFEGLAIEDCVARSRSEWRRV
ncbi:MAG TPA: FAD-dependent oxidoreductase, partial [Anaeromyxobacteraceae bacterium]|nr:FAD-dependent oxidoreductase [Anaeromyxobacteraceae bacterium]